MVPAASVSGVYLAHPEARYFNVGPIGSDQLEDWAARNAVDLAAARRALSTLLP
jgi:5-methyltetrahydrofolate--homocysteine methyltransferase